MLTIARPVVLAIAISTVLVMPSAYGQAPLPTAKSPEEVGLSSAQLKRLEAVSQAHVDSGVLPGR